jgi:hypothetical protein
MYAQTRLAAALLLASLAIAACSPSEDASLVSEARASSPSPSDYGWRTAESPSAERDGTVFEYQ